MSLATVTIVLEIAQAQLVELRVGLVQTLGAVRPVSGDPAPWVPGAVLASVVRGTVDGVEVFKR